MREKDRKAWQPFLEKRIELKINFSCKKLNQKQYAFQIKK